MNNVVDMLDFVHAKQQALKPALVFSGFKKEYSQEWFRLCDLAKKLETHYAYVENMKIEHYLSGISNEMPESLCEGL